MTPLGEKRRRLHQLYPGTRLHAPWSSTVRPPLPRRPHPWPHPPNPQIGALIANALLPTPNQVWTSPASLARPRTLSTISNPSRRQPL